MIMAVSRDTLYDEVWTEPMTKVAARHAVSSSFLARVCEQLNVPRPPRGYWAQLEVGKAPAKPALPEARPGDPLEWIRGGEPRRAPRAMPKPPERPSPAPVRSARKRGGPHPLIAGAREHFAGARVSESGHLRPAKRLLVDLFVSNDVLDRALSTANALFTAFERRGHHVTLAPRDQDLRRPAVDERSSGGRDRHGYGSWGPDRPTVVYIGTVAIGLTIFELSDSVEVQYVDGKYVPAKQLPITRRRGGAHDVWSHRRDMASGRLSLRASSPYAVADWEQQWREAKKGELASQVPEIVLALESAAVTIAKLVEEGEQRATAQRREWERQQEQWRREEAERRRALHVKESRQELTAIIDAWGAAKQVEGFFEDAERRAAVLDDSARAELIARLRRARELLGGVDALQRFAAWKSPDER